MDKDSEKPKKNIKPDNPNAGHRGRLRAKYSKVGMDPLEFHEFLELLLFQSIPRRDTNKIAHELDKKFDGSLVNILEASDNKLKQIKGISDQTILDFRIYSDIVRRCNIEIATRPTEETDIKNHENHLIAHYTGKRYEEVVLLTLNNRMELISKEVIYVGSVHSAKVDVHKMVQIALDDNAPNVIVAHNHPNGRSYPSPKDMETTRRFDRIFTEIGINFVEHYVVSDTKIAGIKERSIYNYIK